MNSPHGELTVVCPKVSPEQLLEKEPAGLRVRLGSLVFHAQTLNLITSTAKQKKNPNKNESEERLRFWHGLSKAAG